MSYTLYTTDALVLRGFNHDEADRVFILYTRDFGRITVRAKGIRLLKSKLRFALQTYSFATVSLIQGRYDWRVVNALPGQSESSLGLSNMHLRIISLLNRFIQGEIKDSTLFDFLQSALTTQLSPEKNKELYLYVAFSLLWKLGYISVPVDKESLLLLTPEESLLDTFALNFPRAEPQVTLALTHSHL